MGSWGGAARGVAIGAVTAVAGLGVLSQMAPLPQGALVAGVAPKPAPVAPVAAGGAATPAPVVADVAADTGADVPAPAAGAGVAPDPGTSSDASAVAEGGKTVAGAPAVIVAERAVSPDQSAARPVEPAQVPVPDAVADPSRVARVNTGTLASGPEADVAVTEQPTSAKGVRPDAAASSPVAVATTGAKPQVVPGVPVAAPVLASVAPPAPGIGLQAAAAVSLPVAVADAAAVMTVPAPPAAALRDSAPAANRAIAARPPQAGTAPVAATRPVAPEARPLPPVAALPAIVARGDASPGLALPAPGPEMAPPVPPAAPPPDRLAETAPALLARPAPLPPAQGLTPNRPVVTTGRLPTVTEAPSDLPRVTPLIEAESGPGAAPAIIPAPKPAATIALANAPAPVAADAAEPPRARFKRVFDNPAGKPMLAIVLFDTGDPALDRPALAALPFPVTFVLDPSRPEAALAAGIYRGGGQEVAMLATAIPEGATAADVEQTFGAHDAAIPEAVAVVVPETGGFQDNRPLSTLVVPVIAAQGRGLLSWDRGLNAADQVARREGAYTATIFRRLDGDAEDADRIRQYLDRAAFKAAQEGKVIVAGDTRPETLAALLAWAVEGRAATVAFAPLTAVLRVE